MNSCQTGRQNRLRFSRIRALPVLLLLILFFNSCRSLPQAATYADVTLRLKNFMQDCFSGDPVNGTSTSHVSYGVSVLVEEYSGGSFKLYDTKTAASPTGPDKSQVDVPIRIPAGGVSYKISVTIDAYECSKCHQSYCNSYRQWEYGTYYVFNAGKPYWKGELGDNKVPSSGIIALTPGVAPRYPNRYPPEDCNCKIQDN